MRYTHDSLYKKIVDFSAKRLYYYINNSVKELIDGDLTNTQTHRRDYGSYKALLKTQLTCTKGTCTAGEVPGYCFPQASKT